MPADVVPQSRAYRHIRCNAETVVSGQPFEIVSNPMSSMEQTMCSACGVMCPIHEIAWSDTGELLSDYYARHTTSATPTQCFLCSKKFMVAVILKCALPAAAGGWLLMGNTKCQAKLVVGGGGFFVGAMAGLAVFLSVFANPIKRKVCGGADTRTLT